MIRNKIERRNACVVPEVRKNQRRE